MKYAAIAFLFVAQMAFASNVDFITPHDGTTVKETFKVKFKVKGMKVAKAGEVTAHTGHHHLIIDGQPVPQGEIVPKDATHMHFGDGATSTTLTLTPGDHTLTLQFADGAHKSYGPDYTKTITVHVKAKK